LVSADQCKIEGKQDIVEAKSPGCTPLVIPRVGSFNYLEKAYAHLLAGFD